MTDVRPGLCPSTIHAAALEPQPPATVAGTFSTRWLNDRPDEPAEFCESCARALWFGPGFFTPADLADLRRFEEWAAQALGGPTPPPRGYTRPAVPGERGSRYLVCTCGTTTAWPPTRTSVRCTGCGAAWH